MLHAEQEELALAAPALRRTEFARPRTARMVATRRVGFLDRFRLGRADPDAIEKA